MTILRCAVLAMVASVLLPAPASAAKPRRCPSGANVTVLAAGAKIQVVDARAEEEIWGCVRATGRGRPIADSEFDGTAVAKVRGRLAAVVMTGGCDRYEGGCAYNDLVVWDVVRGKRTLRRVYGLEDDVFADFDAFEVLTGGGVMAVLRVGANRELWRLCPGDVQRALASPDVAPRLERDGRIIWSYSLATGDRTQGQGDRCRVKRER